MSTIMNTPEHTTATTSSFTRTHVLPFIAGVCTIVLVTYLYGSYLREQTQTLLTQRAATERSEVRALRELMDGGRATDAVRAVIRDCPDRNRFDSLLGQLETLSVNELSEVEELFYRCGDYFALRDQVMALQLVNAADALQVTVRHLTALGEATASSTYRPAHWGQIAQLEAEQADAFQELVRLQGAIIVALRGGATRTSENVSTLLSEVNETRTTIDRLEQRIEQLE